MSQVEHAVLQGFVSFARAFYPSKLVSPHHQHGSQLNQAVDRQQPPSTCQAGSRTVRTQRNLFYSSSHVAASGATADADILFGRSLGIELAKTLSLNYSNQETSVTIGESVRDEDGISLPESLCGLVLC